MLKLPPEVERMNQQLKDNYGVDIITGEPIWRISWAANELEKLHTEFTDFTPSGVFLRRVTETREVPKYPWWPNMFILERLVLVPDVNKDELLGKQVSYECLWAFHDNNENPLPPNYEVCERVIYEVYKAQYGPKSDKLKKFKHLDVYGANSQEELLLTKARVDKLCQEMFGDESEWHGDSVDASGSTILMPKNYVKES